MRLALYQPDIAQNVGAAIRIAACFGAGLDIIGPCGFPLVGKDIRRTAMDYQLLASPELHDGWTAFENSPTRKHGRLILLTTASDVDLYDIAFEPDDCLMMGRESAGAPQDVHDSADIRARIAIAPQARSLNMAVAAAVALSEARRQIGWS